MRRSLRVVLLLAVPALLRAQAPTANIVTIEVGDYAFTRLPARIPAGLTTVRLVNRGTTLHHMQLNRLKGGVTVTQMLREFKGGEPLPAYLSGAGGPSAAWAGQTIEATMVLEPGTYGVFCWVPAADHQLHFQKGMYGQIIVDPAPSAPTTLPDADLTIHAFDFNYRLSKPITAGRRVIRVQNDGPQSHELVLVRLAPGKTVMDVRDWAERGQTGASPGVMLNGVAAIAPGAAVNITNDFSPGNYAIICFVPSNSDHKGLPHVHYGMLQQFTVR